MSLVDSHGSRVSRVESELLETKQRPFQFDGSCGNEELRIETQQLRIESRFSTRISILNSRKDRESSVNLLLNGTVCLYQQESIILYQNFVSVNCLYMSRDLAEKSLKEENSEEHLASNYYIRTASA